MKVIASPVTWNRAKLRIGTSGSPSHAELPHFSSE